MKSGRWYGVLSCCALAPSGKLVVMVFFIVGRDGFAIVFCIVIGLAAVLWFAALSVV